MSYQISMEELESEIESTLRALRGVQYKKLALIRDAGSQYILERFGVVICCIYPADYGHVNNTIREKLGGYRYVYVSTSDNLNSAREQIIWALMEGGYLTYVRDKFPRQHKNIIQFNDFGNKIINERIRRWANQPRYKFLIEQNANAKGLSTDMLLSIDPGFFDHMPEVNW